MMMDIPNQPTPLLTPLLTPAESMPRTVVPHCEGNKLQKGQQGTCLFKKWDMAVVASANSIIQGSHTDAQKRIATVKQNATFLYSKDFKKIP